MQFLNKLSKIYLLLNLAVYSIYFGLLTLLFTLPTDDVARIVHPVEVISLLLHWWLLRVRIVGVLCRKFKYCGSSWLRHLRTACVRAIKLHGCGIKNETANVSQSKLALYTLPDANCIQIGYLTIVCSIVFSLRSVIIFLSIFVLRPDMVVLNLLSKLVFHLLCELGPTLTIIWFLNKSRSNINDSQQPLLL